MRTDRQSRAVFHSWWRKGLPVEPHGEADDNTGWMDDDGF